MARASLGPIPEFCRTLSSVLFNLAPSFPFFHLWFGCIIMATAVPFGLHPAYTLFAAGATAKSEKRADNAEKPIRK